MDRQMVELVKERIEKVLPEMIEFRRLLHSTPEVGIETPETASKIRKKLEKTSIFFQKPLIGGDVVGALKGQSDRTICLRADVDAIPTWEESDLPYKSTVPGAMHGCGHDGHTAAMVGAALVLDSVKDQLPVSVRFVFQPGEELYCGGGKLVEAGVCDGCEAAFAYHCWPYLPEGCVGARVGAMFGAGIQFKISLTGKGCHGAEPEKGHNPIPVASRIVSEFDELHKELQEREGSLISVCRVASGTSSNIIPDTAEILGTVRFIKPEYGDVIMGEMDEIIIAVTEGTGVSAKTEYDTSYSLPVLNTKSGYKLIKDIASTELPKGCWQELPAHSRGMEDFAFYLKDREGAMFFLGLGEQSSPLHSSTFDFNDNVLSNAILMHCLIALEYERHAR